MGFFGNGGNSGAQDTGKSASDRIVDEEIKRNAAETEEKRKRITQERLEIIHSQGNQDWHSKG